MNSNLMYFSQLKEKEQEKCDMAHVIVQLYTYDNMKDLSERKNEIATNKYLAVINNYNELDIFVYCVKDSDCSLKSLVYEIVKHKLTSMKLHKENKFDCSYIIKNNCIIEA